jgi:hypothetical protein
MVTHMRLDMGIDSEELLIAPEIDRLILIDRSVDYFTPMCSQLTYEGLVDETFGFKASMCSIVCARFC